MENERGFPWKLDWKRQATKGSILHKQSKKVGFYALGLTQGIHWIQDKKKKKIVAHWHCIDMNGDSIIISIHTIQKRTFGHGGPSNSEEGCFLVKLRIFCYILFTLSP